jgi:hypothetical protein
MHIIEILILFNLIHSFSTISNKFQNGFCFQNSQTDPTIYMKMKSSVNSQNSHEKEQILWTHISQFQNLLQYAIHSHATIEESIDERNIIDTPV